MHLKSVGKPAQYKITNLPYVLRTFLTTRGSCGYFYANFHVDIDTSRRRSNTWMPKRVGRLGSRLSDMWGICVRNVTLFRLRGGFAFQRTPPFRRRKKTGKISKIKKKPSLGGEKTGDIRARGLSLFSRRHLYARQWEKIRKYELSYTPVLRRCCVMGNVKYMWANKMFPLRERNRRPIIMHIGWLLRNVVEGKLSFCIIMILWRFNEAYFYPNISIYSVY